MTETDRNTRRRMLDAFKVRFHDNEKSEGYDDRLMAALEEAVAVRDAALETNDAAPSTLPIAGEGKVKALDWEGSGTWNVAATVVGRYVVRPCLATKYDGQWLMRRPEKETSDLYPSEAEAKRAAQAAYETRILSALISSPGKDGGQEVDLRRPLRMCVDMLKSNGFGVASVVEVAERALAASCGKDGGQEVERDFPAEFEAWWETYRHKNREPADYSVKKQIAFDAFYFAGRPQPASTALVDPKQVAREIAVAVVDLARGYTLEFSGNPAAHKDDYDRAEVEVMRLLEVKP